MTQITFTSDWQQILSGQLRPGESFTVIYDNARLPQQRDTYNGLPTWNIFGYAQYANGGPIDTQTLQTPGAGEMMSAELIVPKDAQSLAMWFMNTGRGGQQYYDSDYGQNYHFPVMRSDVELLSASVSSDPMTPYSGFSLSVGAVAQVTALSVLFTTEPPYAGDPGPQDVALSLTSTKTSSGLNIWQSSGIIVPYGAKVSFSLQYVIAGKQYIDDHGGVGYHA